MKPPRSVPQTDPKAGYVAQREMIDQAVRRVFDGGRYVLGPEVEAFEAEFAAFLGAGHAVGVASGTDAIILALRALGIGAGDRVATVSHTAVATVAAIEAVGAVPVLVDIDEQYGMDPDSLAAVLEETGRPVRAVVPVHLYGQPAALSPLLELAARHGLAVIEDASQAHGASYDGKRVGTFGDIGVFSLYPTKNLGAVGDGGVAVTSNSGLAERLRGLRQYGWQDRYVSETPGFNSRLDELQAAILRVKLTALSAMNRRRLAVAEAYDEGLAGLPVVRPRPRPRTVSVYHQYVIQAEERDALRDALSARGIGTGIHYPVPVHLQPAYRGRLGLAPDGLPRTELAAGRILSLPMYPEISDDDVQYTIQSIQSFFA